MHEVTLASERVEEVKGEIRDVHADAGYISSRFCMTIARRDATPWVRLRSTSKGRLAMTTEGQRPHPAHISMMDAHQEHEEAWLKKYHQRSRIERCFSGFKQRMGENLRAMEKRLQRVELTFKMLVWNLTRCLRHAPLYSRRIVATERTSPTTLRLAPATKG